MVNTKSSAAQPAYRDLVKFWRKYNAGSPQGFHHDDDIPTERPKNIKLFKICQSPSRVVVG
jgi:hypothetical protein